MIVAKQNVEMLGATPLRAFHPNMRLCGTDPFSDPFHFHFHFHAGLTPFTFTFGGFINIAKQNVDMSGTETLMNVNFCLIAPGEIDSS